MTIIKVAGLTKDYRVRRKQQESNGLLTKARSIISPSTDKLRALKAVNFEVEEGEFLGYIGPNGSGKSTTIKLMTGVLTPTEGTATIMGYVPWKQRKEYTRNIGVIFGSKSLLFWDLPVIDSLKLYKDIYDLDNKDFTDRLEEFDKIFQLSKLIDRPVRKLSLGERMRSEIAAALIHNPPVLFLDEPTIGLDGLAKQEITNFLKKYQQREKTTVVLTTHTISDIEALCERVIILNLGEIIYDGSILNLRGKFDERIVHLTLSHEIDATVLFNEFDQVVKISDKQYDLVTNKESVKRLLSDILETPAEILDIQISEPSLETIIKEIYTWKR
ncbi:MAG: ABC transporter ATP-binding protein [Candidatus Hodarchaeales archaeon]|jgi:ABC-2 type transport system ATP-binding protein